MSHELLGTLTGSGVWSLQAPSHLGLPAVSLSAASRRPNPSTRHALASSVRNVASRCKSDFITVSPEHGSS